MKGRKGHLALVTGGASPSRCPAPPAYLSEQAKREWKRAATDLHKRRLLGSDMLATLESYCIAVGIIRETEDLMRAEGRMLATDEGPKPHPAFRMQSAAMREARLLAAELALTPHRRGKKGPEGLDDEDDLSDLGL